MVLTEITYKEAGVDTCKASQLIDKIKPLAQNTFDSKVLNSIGGFGAMYELPTGYNKPVLVSATDGVGTKLMLANQFNMHSGIGIDLVAMNVNDLITCGAKPLFFLDYLACSELDLSKHSEVIEGIAAGCKIAGCSLVGGETAEMPGIYQAGDYDLAGFCVGIVEKEETLPRPIAKKNILIGIASSGLHSNGYSLVRKIISEGLLKATPENKQLLLEPTKIYTEIIEELHKNKAITACAHITGDGLAENLTRVLGNNAQALINLDSWVPSKIYKLVAETQAVSEVEMLKVFNCGIGMIIATSEPELVLETAKKFEENAFVIGECHPSNINTEVSFRGSLNL